MNEEILNENIDVMGPAQDNNVAEDVVDEQPIVNDDIPVGETFEEDIIKNSRVNPFCVISKAVYEVEDTNGKKHYFHLIETNSGWSENPYGDTYVVVPDEMVQAIMETRGFCDIELSEDRTEVVSFTAREIPEIPTQEPEPTEEQKRIAELEESVIASEQAITDLDLQDIETQQTLTDMDIRLMALEG